MSRTYILYNRGLYHHLQNLRDDYNLLSNYLGLWNYITIDFLLLYDYKLDGILYN